jgi:hypothetical protein
MTHLRSVSPREGRRRFAVGDPVQCSDGRSGIVRALTGEMLCEVQPVGSTVLVTQHDLELLPETLAAASQPYRAAQPPSYRGEERRAA